MATFVLVHGTFVKSADWPDLQRALAETTRELGESSNFDQMHWTGKNRASARQAAALEISDAVNRIRSQSPLEKIFLIGHSHGGSAIAYFVKSYPEISKTISGVAFLSTPFVAIREKDRARQMLAATMFVPLGIVATMWWVLTSPNQPGDPLAISDISLISLVGIAVVAILWALMNERMNAVINRLTIETISQQTAALPHGNYLFLRCSGDEAASALSTANFLSWLGTRTSNILRAILEPLFSSRPFMRFWYWFIVLLLGLSIQFTLFVLAVAKKVGIQGIVDYLLAQTWGGGEYAYIVLIFLLVFVAMACVLALAAAFVIFFVQACTMKAFGWSGLSASFFLEFSVEPLPFGSHSLIHIDWKHGTHAVVGLMHSCTYTHPCAIKHLKEWVGTTLINSSTLTPLEPVHSLAERDH